MTAPLEGPENGRSQVRRGRREVPLEPEKGLPGSSVHDPESVDGSHGHDSRLVDDYRRNDAVIHLHLFINVGREFGEPPLNNLCIRFGVAVKAPQSKPVFRRERGNRYAAYYAPYDMKVSMFVDPVEFIDPTQRLANPEPLIIPSVVRLQELDCCPVAVTQTSYLRPFSGGTRGTGSSVSTLLDENREHRSLSRTRRDLSSISTDMKFISQIVEGCPEVEETVPDKTRSKVGIERLTPEQVKVVLESIRVELCGDWTEVVLNPMGMELLVERFDVSVSSVQFEQWADQASRHDLPLEDDGRRRAGTDAADTTGEGRTDPDSGAQA